MKKTKILIPKRENETPFQRFEQFAKKVVTTPKGRLSEKDKKQS